MGSRGGRVKRVTESHGVETERYEMKRMNCGLCGWHQPDTGPDLPCMLHSKQKQCLADEGPSGVGR